MRECYEQLLLHVCVFVYVCMYVFACLRVCLCLCCVPAQLFAQHILNNWTRYYAELYNGKKTSPHQEAAESITFGRHVSNRLAYIWVQSEGGGSEGGQSFLDPPSKYLLGHFYEI
jgi:hypothetical protein